MSNASVQNLALMERSGIRDCSELFKKLKSPNKKKAVLPHLPFEMFLPNLKLSHTQHVQAIYECLVYFRLFLLLNHLTKYLFFQT